jgi:hypothetical protein
VSTQDRLLGALSRVYDTTPDPILGLRLSYLSGSMSWTIADDTLTTIVVGGMGVSLTIDLSQYTLTTLATYLASQPGYVVLYLDDTGYASLSALALVPGSSDISVSNGDHLLVARNPTWILFAALAAELTLAKIAIDLMPAEMATTTANGEWLDVLGGYYAVPRQLGEADVQYAPRIPAEVILPRQNNVAIAAALEAATGQNATCTDAPVFGNPEPAFDGAISFSGAPHFYNASARIIFNLFDVAIGYALLGSATPTDFLFFIRQQIDRLRAAGTHLRNLTLLPSVMGDVFTPPTDALVENVFVNTLQGTGHSSNSGFATGIFPIGMFGVSVSFDTAIGTASSQAQLVGSGSSVDRVAFPNLAGTGSQIQGAQGPAFSSGFSVGFASLGFGAGAVLTSGQGAHLAGTGISADTTFAFIGNAVIFNGVSASADAATGTLRTGGGLVAADSSLDSATGVLTTKVQLVGTGTSGDAGIFNPSQFVGAASGSSTDSATAVLTTKIQVVGTSSGSDSTTAALLTNIFGAEFSNEF